MNSFFVDKLIETLSVKRLDRFALKVICLVLFVGWFVCCFLAFFLLFFFYDFFIILVLKCLYLSYNYKVK